MNISNLWFDTKEKAEQKADELRWNVNLMVYPVKEMKTTNSDGSQVTKYLLQVRSF